MPSVELVSSWTWDCPYCSREVSQRFQTRIFDWSAPDDVATLEASFPAEEVAQWKAKYPGGLRLYIPRTYLTCPSCGVEMEQKCEGDRAKPIPTPAPDPVPPLPVSVPEGPDFVIKVDQ